MQAIDGKKEMDEKCKTKKNIKKNKEQKKHAAKKRKQKIKKRRYGESNPGPRLFAPQIR